MEQCFSLKLKRMDAFNVYNNKIFKLHDVFTVHYNKINKKHYFAPQTASYAANTAFTEQLKMWTADVAFLIEDWVNLMF